MSKAILMSLIISLLSVGSLIGQDTVYYNLIPVSNGRIIFSRVIEIEDVSKEDLWLRVKMWGVDNYNSEKNALESEDKEIGFITYKGIMPITLHYQGGLLKGKKYTTYVNHTLKFFIKDGKVKVEISDLVSNMEVIGVEISQSFEEYYLMDVSQYSKSKQDKVLASIVNDAMDTNRQIEALFNSIQNELRSKNSDFNF